MTLPGNETLLLVYVRLATDQEIYEELFFAISLTTNTKGDKRQHRLLLHTEVRRLAKVELPILIWYFNLSVQ